MAYCTYIDLAERFGALELDQLTNHVGDCPAIQSAINDASSEIDLYLAGRYVLPLLPPIPVALKRCACDIVRYYLWDTQTTDHIRGRYLDAVAQRLAGDDSPGGRSLRTVGGGESSQCAAAAGGCFRGHPVHL